MRVNMLFCWVAGDYTHNWRIDDDVCPDAGRNPHELMLTEDASHLRVAPLPDFDRFGLDNIVPLFTFWARHGTRTPCAGQQASWKLCRPSGGCF